MLNFKPRIQIKISSIKILIGLILALLINQSVYSQCLTPPSYDYTITPTTSWQTTSNSMSGGCHIYRIYMITTDGYDFTVCGNDGVGASTNNDGDFTLYNSIGTQQWYIDGASGCGYDASTIGTAYEEWSPPSDGYYYLKVDDYSSAAITYTLAYKYTGAPPAGPCLSAPNGQYPASTFTPSCTGSPESITSDGYAGEYSVVNVVSGTDYTFTSSNGSDYITISNSVGTIGYAYGTTPVAWTATFTGTIRFYTHTSSACGSASVNRTRSVTCSGAPPSGPANDLCANATALPCGTSNLAGTTNSTVSETSPGCASSAYGVWYTFTGDGNSTTITVQNVSLDTEFGLYSGSCGSLSSITCQDAFGAMDPEVYTFTSTNGVDYFIYVGYYGTGTTTGDFTISRTCVGGSSPPANDDCANAIALPCATSNLAGTTVDAVSESAPGTCVGGYGVWYTFTGDGNSTTISTVAGAGFDQGMYIGYGTCASRTQVICKDAAGGGGTETHTFTPTNGTTYFVYVAQYTGSTTGTFTITRTCVVPSGPVNDLCANATALPCATSNLAGTTVDCVSESAPGTCVGGYGVWYTFTGDGNSTTISTVAGAGFDQGMYIGYGTCASRTQVICKDAAGSGGTETHTFTSTNGTTYFVYVAQYTGSTTGTFTISRTCTSPPANDECANATALPCGTTNLAGTTVNTVSETHGTGCTMSAYGVWYTFTGDGNSTTISTTAAAGFNHEMAIASGSCGSLTNIACRDVGFSGGIETYTFTTTIGVDYYVYVGYYLTGTTTGDFTISRTCTSPPANDDCANATALPCGTTNLAGSTNLTASETSPGCGSGYGVWYTFTGAGNSTTISTDAEATFNQEMGIYSGSCGSLSNIACKDASWTGGVETYTFSTTIGVDYYIYVADYGSGTATGDFTITRTCVAPPVNDDCANATNLPCGTTNLAGTTDYTTNTVHGTGCSMSNYGVWYTFVGDGNSTTISTNPSFDIKLSIASGSCGSLSNIACTDASPETATFTTTLGTTYYVYVAYWTSGTTTGDFTISRTCTSPPVNDECANATALPCGTTNLAGSTNFSVIETSPGCGSDYGVWYTFTGDGNSTTISTDAEATFNQEMGIYSGSCGSFTSVTCQDAAFSGGIETYTFTSTIGVDYYVYVADYGSGTATGDFTISRSCIAPPCSSVLSIPDCGAANSQTYTGGGSGQWGSSPCYFSTPGIEQVYSFVAPVTGPYSIQVTAASGYVTYNWQASSCAETGWTCIGEVSTTGEYGSMSWTAGTTYYILLDDENTTAGTHTFYIDCPVDPCSNAISIADCGAANSQTYTGGSTGDWGSSPCYFSTPGIEQVYSFVAPLTGPYSIQVTAASGYVTYNWQASSCAETGWTCIGEVSTTGEYGSMSWTAGTTYYILLDDENTTAGTHTFYIDCPVDPCSNAISIADCGAANSQTYTGGSTGDWGSSPCYFSTPGIEQVYSFVAPLTGPYSIQVTAASGYVTYNWQASSCAETGWTCIGEVSTTGEYGSMSWTAGTTYYILLDDENTTAGTHTFYIDCPVDPCSNAISIADCGAANSQTYTGGSTGDWGSSPCYFSTPGIEQVYSFVAPLTGPYSIQVTTASGYVTYNWQASSCAETGWTCIGEVSTTGEYGSMSWTAGTTYYILLDDENTTAGTHTFYIDCPVEPCFNVISIPDCGVTNSQTYTGGGTGDWGSSPCYFSTPGIEQIYSFVAPVTGTYSIQVTAASGYVTYDWQASSCAETGWTCISEVNTTGTYGSMSWTAGVTYYILLDDENSTTGTHSFFIKCPPGVGSDCEWTVCLEDSYGDGWWGEIEVIVDGSSLGFASLASGSGPDCYIVYINDESTILIDYTSGLFDDVEEEYYLYDMDNNLVHSEGVGGTVPSDYTYYNAYCGGIPNCATTTLNDTLCSSLLEWTMPSTGINPDGYTLYFGTNNPPTNIINALDVGDTTMWDVGPLTLGQTYYWQVVPYENGYGDAVGCSVWNFYYQQGPSEPVASAFPLCIFAGDSTEISATVVPGSTIYWYTGWCGGIFVDTGNTLTVTPPYTVTYYATAFDGTCFSECDTTVVTVSQLCMINAWGNGTSDTIDICPGDPVTLTSNGNCDYLMFNDFNTGTSGAGWTSNATPMFNNPCGPGLDGTIHLWVGSATDFPRELVTQPYIVTDQCEICFEMKYSEQTGFSGTDCEGPDLPGEGVHLQWSTDGGATWIDIIYYNPNGGYDPVLTEWTPYCVPIPVAAASINTQFRWFQDVTSGYDFDHWGLDNVEISCAAVGQDIQWSHGPTVFNPAATVSPAVSTLYSVIIDDGLGWGNYDTAYVYVNVAVLNSDTIVTNTSCYGNNDGDATAVAVDGGGTPLAGTFDYLWSTTETTATVNGLSANPYGVTITDAAGCTINSTAIVSNPPIPLTIVDVTAMSGECNIVSPNNWVHIPNSLDNTEIIASVFDATGGNDLLLTEAEATIFPTVQYISGMPYLQRVVRVTPASTGPATVRIYFTNAEYAALQAAYPSITNVSQLAVTKCDDAGSWTNCILLTPSTFAVSPIGVGYYAEVSVTSFSKFYIHPDIGAPLPVELVSFSAFCDNNEITFNWATTTESNNNYFTLEKSDDLISFIPVRTVEGSGNSNELINYSTSETNNNDGVTYYRLKQTDYDGNFKYSEILIVDCKTENDENDIIVINNPDLNYIIVSFKGQSAEKFTINLIDYLGRSVMQETLSTSSGNNYVKFDKNMLSAGLYNIVIQSSNILITKQIVIPR